jgi:ketosteroid isomerase-like protein
MMKSLKILALIFVMIFGFGVVQGFAQILSSEKEEVWKQEEAFYESWKKGDLKGFMALWHKDAQLWSHVDEQPMKKNWVENYFTGAKFKIESYKLKEPTVDIFGNIAIVYFSATVEVSSGEPAYLNRVIHLWTKQDKKWLLIGGMNNRR